MRAIMRIGAILICSAAIGFGVSAQAEETSRPRTEINQSVQNQLPWRSLESLIVTSSCCRICTRGKACGNSCIARDRQCHQPPGCACDG